MLLCFLILLGIVTTSMSSSFSGPTVKQVGMNMVKAAPLIVPGDYSSRTISDQVATKPPVIQGWGGVTLDEASNGQMQSTLQRLNQSGYNAVRVGFSAGTTPCSSGELGDWSSAWFSQT
ncbi:hypothetical protein E6H27_03635, partial [Candidatus Bathyarchaeota archaeon]